jgi:hypothetical protein
VGVSDNPSGKMLRISRGENVAQLSPFVKGKTMKKAESLPPWVYQSFLSGVSELKPVNCLTI